MNVQRSNSNSVFIENLACDDWKLCCCGCQMGEGGDICRHDGCRSMLEYTGAICKKFEGKYFCHTCFHTKKEHIRGGRVWVITITAVQAIAALAGKLKDIVSTRGKKWKI